MSAEAQNPEPLEVYLSQADSWNKSAYRRARAAARRAWLVAALAIGLAIAAVLALMLMVPLKRTEVVPVLVNRSTGEVRVLQSLSEQTITPNEAITQALLVRYVVARETYQREDLERFYERVATLSAPQVFQRYKAQFSADGDKNPIERFGTEVRAVTLKSVTLLSGNAGQVRFFTEVAQPAGTLRNDWIATIRYDYVNTPTQLRDRIDNPLGFQVTSYRVDQEIFNAGGEHE